MISVRRLRSVDADAFRTIRLKALRDHPTAFGTSYDDAKTQSVQEFARKIETRYGIGAFDGNALVGICFLDNEQMAKARHRGWITAVYVLPSHRGSGVGTKMMAHVVEAALDHDLLQLELFVAGDNPAAMRFYERCGFRQTGIVPRALIVDGADFDEIMMVKTLDA